MHRDLCTQYKCMLFTTSRYAYKDYTSASKIILQFLYMRQEYHKVILYLCQLLF